ncbi:PPA1309 family protein [Streptomyces sp. NBC_01808]|uniref:PPA1309 family protein n=1 Tax=Streptomyces sp. NBC_01808 TaxID=2975947 RepID=UPI002DDB1C28|nr:PPA1309 family protein [Streptomyces sp. NBC_01808]WSA40480.1 PPA1309 family protein [Streptomyces sp. NBC_01808]
MSNSPTGGPPLAADPLTRAVLELDEYAAGFGWDRPPRLFALVDTARLRAQEPDLAQRLNLDAGQGAGGSPAAEPAAGPAAQVSYTPIEQQELPAGQPLDEFLGTIAWPDAVGGCALTVERLMLPPAAEAEVPDDLDEAGLAAWVAGHPRREEVRMTVGVLRNGSREAAVRLRSKDAPTEVLTGPDLVPGLAQALAATFD